MRITAVQKFLAAAWPKQTLLAGCFIGIFLLVVSLTVAALLPTLQAFRLWQSSLLLGFCVLLAVPLGLLLGLLGMFLVFVIIVMPLEELGGRLNGAPFHDGDVVRILSGVHHGKSAVVRGKTEKGFLCVDGGEKIPEGESVFHPCQLLRERKAESARRGLTR